MNHADDAPHCRCGGEWYEDPTPGSWIEVGPRPRRLFCRLCGRDWFPRVGEVVAR